MDESDNVYLFTGEDIAPKVIDSAIDKDGNQIYLKFEDGIEEWYTYDNENIVCIKSSTGYECHYKFDENGNMIYSKDIFNSKVSEQWLDYYIDDDGRNMIHVKQSDGTKFYIQDEEEKQQ